MPPKKGGRKKTWLAASPDNGGHNDEDSLQERSNGVRHRRDQGEEGKGKDVLSKVSHPVRQEEDQDMRGHRLGHFQKQGSLIQDPHRHHGHKGKERRVIQQIKLIQLAICKQLRGGRAI